jgi:putative transposase
MRTLEREALAERPSGSTLARAERVTLRRPPRLDASQYIGPHRIFFTMCTFDRRPLFIDAAIVEMVNGELLRTGSENGVEVTAYCFMPDHLHTLLTGQSQCANVKHSVFLFRQASGYRYRQRCRERLWQEGYFDRHLRSEDAVFDVVRYIVDNPVRAKLCETAVDYPYSGSSRYDLRAIVDTTQWRPDSLG